MHSFVSSSAGSANLFSRKTSRSGSVTAYNQRRVSRLSEHLRQFSISQGMAAAVVASNVATNNKEAEKTDRAKLIECEDPILARTITVEESFRRMEVFLFILSVYGFRWWVLHLAVFIEQGLVYCIYP